MVKPLPDDETWTWRPGQAVELQWSPSGDLGLSRLVTVEMLHLVAPGVVNDLVQIRNVTEGDVLSFTVPSSLQPGSYILDLSPSRTVACGSPLPAAVISTTLTKFGASYPITIAP